VTLPAGALGAESEGLGQVVVLSGEAGIAVPPVHVPHRSR